jgi:ABC-2 type transport system permease protein
MRYALLIALREFLENAKTKGFWIGIFMFPILLGGSIAVSVFLAMSSPTRHFVLVDQSGELAQAFEMALERAYQASVLDALNRYAQANANDDNQRVGDLSGVSSAQMEQMNARAAAGNREVIDRFVESGGADAFLAQLRPILRDDAPPFVPPRRQFVRLEPPEGVDERAGIDTIAQQLRPYLNGERRVSVDGAEVNLFAAVLIGPDALNDVTRPGVPPAGGSGAGPSRVQYWSSNLTDRGLPNVLGRALNDEVQNREYVALGVSLATVERARQTGIAFSSFDPSKAEGEETVSLADTIVNGAPIAFVYLLWISIFIVVQMLLNNTIEEKSNRIIEVLLSSVTPGELMMGKLIGIAAVGVAIVGTWLVTLFLGIQLYQGAGAQVVGQALDAVVASGLMPAFVLYFVLGYLLYAGIFLSIGSLCNSLKEAQNLQGPMMMIMMVPLLTMVFINRDPHGPLATVLTWIPIYTPFTMMNRAAADPPLFDLIGSIVLMVVTTALILWLSGKIFRIGILRTGQRPKLVELVRWIRSGDA